MIIHQPEIKIEGNEVLVSTRIEMKGNYSIPKELWFKYPLEYQDAFGWFFRKPVLARDAL